MAQIKLIRKGPSALNALDLAFTIDSTGSMQPWIDQVLDVVRGIVHEVATSATGPDVRLALVEYRDHEGRSKKPPTIAHGFGGVDRFHRDLAGVRCTGGADHPEAVPDGILTAAGLPWRKQAQKAIILIGDAPPHGAGSPGDDFPRGCPCGRTMLDMAGRCVGAGIVVHSVAVTADVVTAREFATIAKLTGGQFATLADAGRFGRLLGSLVREESRKVADDLAVAARYEEESGDVARLARTTGLTPDAVTKSIDRLRAKEGIAVASSASDPRSRSSRIRIIR